MLHLQQHLCLEETVKVQVLPPHPGQRRRHGLTVPSPLHAMDLLGSFTLYAYLTKTIWALPLGEPMPKLSFPFKTLLKFLGKPIHFSLKFN